MPEDESPLLYGLNQNADINYAINEANWILSDILSLNENQSTSKSNVGNEVLKVISEINS